MLGGAFEFNYLIFIIYSRGEAVLIGTVNLDSGLYIFFFNLSPKLENEPYVEALCHLWSALSACSAETSQVKYDYQSIFNIQKWSLWYHCNSG